MNRPLLALALVFAPATAAQAQDIARAEQRLDLAATAPAACVLAQASANNASNASFAATGVTSGQIAITQLVDNASATSLASAVTLSLPLTCNASHRIQVRTANGGLVRTGSNNRGSTGFAEFLAYRVNLAWAGQALDRGSDQGSFLLDTPRPATGTVELRVTTPPGQGPLVAGQYADSIIVEFQPAN